MSTSMLKATRCLLLGLLLASSSTAFAQNNGFQLNRYEPTAAGEWSLAVDHPWYSQTRYFAAGLTLNYGHNPLLFGRPVGDTGFVEIVVAIEHQLIGHIDLAGSFLDRVLITASLPVTLLERGNPIAGVAPIQGAAVSDPRLGVMVRLFGQPYEGPLSISLGASLWVPLRKFNASLPAQSSDQEVRVLPRLVLGGLVRSILWSFTVGVLIRPTANIGDPILLAGRSVGSELQLGAAVGYANRALRLAIGPEVIFSTTLNAQAGVIDSSSLEVLLGVHYNVAKLVQLSLGGGFGVLGQPGTPDGRALLRVSYAPIRGEKASSPPPPSDRDRDGIFDDEDACPRDFGPRRAAADATGCPDRDDDQVIDRLDRCPGVAQGEHPDPALLGCPLRDRDQDGVLDPQDKCPAEAQGEHPDPALLGCPLRDRDQDGVLDAADQCPDTPQGATPDPAKAGCPAGDRDNDSVLDPLDACPDQPGAPSPDRQKNGCPGLVQVTGGKLVIVQPVFFATNKDVILEKSFPVLESVAQALKASPQIKKVRIEGHTDDRGKAEYNTALSGRRATSVMNWLIEHGVEKERLTAQGFGPERPIADNTSRRGRAQNRRVEFVIVEPAQDASVKTVQAKEAAPPDSPDQSDGKRRHHRRHKSVEAPAAATPDAEQAPKRHHRRKKADAAAEPAADATHANTAKPAPRRRHHHRHSRHNKEAPATP